MAEERKTQTDSLEERLKARPDYAEALRRWTKAQEKVRPYQKDIKVSDVRESSAGKWQPSEVLAQREYLEGA